MNQGQRLMLTTFGIVGVPIEQLRDGKLAIYELMAEESAVNYWEVCFK